MAKPVEVTWHAIEQFRSRFPGESGSGSYVRLLIASEVLSAFDQGRYGTKQPTWARDGSRVRGMRNRGEKDRTLRFVWTESKERMYLVDKNNGRLRVVTSIRPEGDKLSA